MESKFFEIANLDTPNEIEEKISAGFTISKEKPEIKKQLHFDTFDWRLFRKDLTLFCENETFYLFSSKNNLPINKIQYKKKNYPLFWQEFPDGALKEELKKHIYIRAVIQILKLEIHENSLKILDKNEKTVVKMNINKTYRKENNSKKLVNQEIQLIPIRGYEEEFSKITNFLTDLELKETSKNIIFTILEEEKNKSGDYTGKLNIDLKSEMTAFEAAKKIHGDLLTSIKQNENGIIKDIDTEFLHDFRVAVRRIRSGLSQIKDVFPEKYVKRFKKDFAILGKNTNRLRDLDVYLLEKDKYIKMLSDDLNKGLEPVFIKLKQERKNEQKKLVKFLETEKYQRIINGFENFLEKSTLLEKNAPNSEKKVIDLAQKFIWNKYSQIINKGKKIDDSTPDRELHDLRIECKKLRYLLEFFSSLFPQKEMSIIIKQLKKLQDNLGNFNDLYVQQQSLKKMLEDFDGSPDEIKKVSASIGGLITTLNQKQIKTRNEFSKYFSELDSINNSKVFKELFQPKGK